MAKNYMQDVAKMLGVELEEEFKIDSSDTIFKFYKNGLCFQCGGAWLRADSNFIDLIKGDSKIVKLPWQPKTNEAYYRPAYKFFGVASEVWTDNPYDYAFKEAGMIFKTKKECEAALPELRKKYLGGENNG